MSKTVRLLVLLVWMAALASPGGAQPAPPAGTVVKEMPSGLGGEFSVQFEPGHPLRRGDIVQVCRGSAEGTLGEAFVTRVEGNTGVISLRSEYVVRAGDQVYFARRPGPVAAAPVAPPPPAEPSETEVASGADSDARPASKPAPKGSLQDPNGRFTIKVPSGWTPWEQQARPDMLALLGPGGQILIVGTRDAEGAEEMLANPQARAGLTQIMAAALKSRDVRVTRERKVTMFGRAGLQLDLQAPNGLQGFMVMLPGPDHIFMGVGVGHDKAGADSALKALKNVRFR